jgi:hypothetical protein
VSPSGRRIGGSSRLSDLESGRAAYARKAWADAREALSRADAASPLEPEDLERLAWSTAMLGRDREMLALLERVHARCLEQSDEPRAARVAFWNPR